MSRKPRNRGERRAVARPAGRGGPERPLGGRLVLALAAAAVVGGLGITVFASRGQATHHPEPREGVTAERVMNPSFYSRWPRIARIYRYVAMRPAVIDGVYCFCSCAEHAGHYSLLECFYSDHGANCHVCLWQAETAYEMDRNGMTLDQIRQRMDDQFQR